MTQTLHRFVTDRADIRRARWETADAGALPEGGVRVRIDAFALTANNITYAAFGEAMSYWAFFPTGDAATGHVPVWGFATVVESRLPALAEGERLYGYWPIASHATLLPGKVREGGFVDVSPHRAKLPAVYNHYRRCAADPGYDAAREAEQALLQPLFTTAFLIDDFLHDQGVFGARQVLLSSASSKTAYATAFCLARRADAVATLGLTSPAHAAFVRHLGCYAGVAEYGQVATLDAGVPSVFVDFNGSPAVRAAVHGRFGDQLHYSCAVGVTDWAAFAGAGPGAGKALPGPRPVFFFAPAQIEKRSADWGPAGLQARIGEAWGAFVRRVSDPARPWLHVAHGHGPEAIARTYTALAEGHVEPRDGHMLHMT
ncbi:MAG: DUF2855 family protein [Rubrivivax sp.]|nr:DUF2855 family protein [Rubrivivax sp.]